MSPDSDKPVSDKPVSDKPGRFNMRSANLIGGFYQSLMG